MADREPPRTSFTGHVRRWGLLALIIVTGVIFHQAGLHDYLSLEAIARNHEWLENKVEENYALALLVYAGVYFLIVAISAPFGVILTLLGGFLFGWLAGSLVTVVAATAGATAIFLAARSSLGGFLAARAGGWLDRLRGGFARDSLYYLLFLRLVPAFPFWLVNIAPALLGMDLPRYVLATFVGIIPGTVAFSLAGAGLESIIAKQSEAYEACVAAADAEGQRGDGKCVFTIDPSALLTTELIAAFVALGIVALIPVVLRRVRGA